MRNSTTSLSQQDIIHLEALKAYANQENHGQSSHDQAFSHFAQMSRYDTKSDSELKIVRAIQNLLQDKEFKPGELTSLLNTLRPPWSLLLTSSNKQNLRQH